jgi:UDP-N-acetylglucosamine 2-epimerase (non-hydrolysing)
MSNKVAIILGTRPEAIKLIPIYLELLKSTNFEPILISTGQHASMLKQIFTLFEITPDIELNVMQPNQTLSSLTAVLFQEIAKVFSQNKFDFVFVQGDTTTGFVSAVSSHYYQYKLVHVEAGLRTHDKWAPFPEEANRKMIGHIADIHFAATDTAVQNLEMENITKNVFNVGNSVIDSLLLVKSKVDKNMLYYTNKFSFLIPENKKIILVTGHRRESFGKGFDEICSSLAKIANDNPNTQIIYPVHMNPNVQEIVFKTLGSFTNIKLIDPLPYDELIYLMSKSWLIMTDSGGIQEEAPTLNVPLIVMRDKTERQEGISSGCSILGGTNSKSILIEFQKIKTSKALHKKMSLSKNPYGCGDTSKKIVDILMTFTNH